MIKFGNQLEAGNKFLDGDLEVTILKLGKTPWEHTNSFGRKEWVRDSIVEDKYGKRPLYILMAASFKVVG